MERDGSIGNQGSGRRRPSRLGALAVCAWLLLGACAEKSEQKPGIDRAAAASAAPKWRQAKGTALIIMDLQKAYLPIVRQEFVFGNVVRLIAAADEADATVVWVYNRDGATREGNPGFELSPAFAPSTKHLKVVKTGSSAFSGTELEDILTARGIGRVVFCGLASNYCVRASVEAAVAAGYRTVVAEDAHSVPSGGDGMAAVDAMNDRWGAQPGLELLPTATVRFLPPSVRTRGLGAADWPLTQGFAAFLDGNFRLLLARSPETVTQAGLSAWAGQDDTALDGMSEEYLAETRRLEREAMASFDAYERSDMSEGDRLSADAYRRWLSDTVALQEFAELDYPVNPTVFGIAYSAESLFTSVQPLGSLEQARAYLTRLAALGGKIDECTGALKRRERNGAIAPRIVLQAALPDILAVADSPARENAMYASLETKLGALTGLGEGARAALLAEAENTIGSVLQPAYRRLAQEIGQQLERAPEEIGVWTIPRGKKYYEALLRAKTTTDLSSDTIHRMGIEALKRIHAEIEAVGARSGFMKGKTAQALVAEAFREGVGPDMALAGYTELLRATEGSITPYFPLYPAAPVEIRTAPQGGYYSPGPIDGSAPGVFYVAKGTGAYKAGMPTLLYHETVPGHHLQIAIAHELDLPVARKLLYFEAYVEGWALYAERFMAESGAYEGDPAGDIGRLQAEAFRAARLVVDTGIHAKRWSFEKAVDFMVSEGLLGRQAAEREVIRYASLPAQATSYYLGFLEFLELREFARTELGDAFEIGAFHRTVLSCGAVPFEVLRAAVKRYVREAKEEG